MLLQPHQKITKKFAEQVEKINDIITNENKKIYSRVKINVQKPSNVKTHNLLYALNLYLTGDNGANAIHITSISDSDEKLQAEE